MNDDKPSEVLSQIQMLDGDEKLTLICSPGVDSDFLERVTNLIRNNAAMRFLQVADIERRYILAFRGECLTAVALCLTMEGAR